MIKYASNAFSCSQDYYINEIEILCEKVGANVQDVARAWAKMPDRTEILTSRARLRRERFRRTPEP